MILPDGRDQIVGLAFPSDFLGNVFVPQNDNSAVAVTDAELCCFQRPQFDQALQDNPNLERALRDKTLTDLHQAHKWMVVLGQMDATERVASLLMQFSKRLAKPPTSQRASAANLSTFVLPLDRGEIAAYLGLTVETVARKLTWMRKRRVNEIRNYYEIRVCDPDALEQLTGTVP